MFAPTRHIMNQHDPFTPPNHRHQPLLYLLAHHRPTRLDDNITKEAYDLYSGLGPGMPFLAPSSSVDATGELQRLCESLWANNPAESLPGPLAVTAVRGLPT